MMNSLDFFYFIIQSCIIWCVIFSTYKLVLSKSKWHSINRFILIILLFIPLVTPFIDLGLTNTSDPLGIETYLLPEINLGTDINDFNSSQSFNLIYVYGCISFLMLIKHGRTLHTTINLKSKKPFFYYKNHKIYLLEDSTAFNFLNQIYVGKTLQHETSILDHEIIHKKAKHSFDLIAITILRSIFWIFPFWNLVTKIFKENHEYFVDQRLLQTVKLSDYLKQIALAGPFKFEEKFVLTSNQMSIFKTRLQMMKNNHKSQFWRYLFLIGISGSVMIACDKSESDLIHKTETSEEDKRLLPPPPPPAPPIPINPSNERSIKFAQADTYPVLDGCDDHDIGCFQTKIVNHIKGNFKYPKHAKELNIEGKAYVAFHISTKGEIKNISLVRKTDSELLNNEALRLIQTLPKANKPAYKDGKPVAIQYVIPIVFKIK